MERAMFLEKLEGLRRAGDREAAILFRDSEVRFTPVNSIQGVDDVSFSYTESQSTVAYPEYHDVADILPYFSSQPSRER